MPITFVNGSSTGTLILLGLASILVASAARPGESFEPHHPANGQLRTTIREVRERQTVRPAAGLEQSVREALRSINEVEGQTDVAAAARLAVELRTAWQEVERARAVGALGYREFDDEKFIVAESKLEGIAAQFRGVRAALPAAGYQAAVRALSDVQALSRAARLAVPGLSSDDVLLMRAKRQRYIAPRGDDGASAPTQNTTDAGSSR